MMRFLTSVAATALVVASATFAQADMIEKTSPHSVDVTLDRL